MKITSDVHLLTPSGEPQDEFETYPGIFYKTNVPAQITDSLING